MASSQLPGAPSNLSIGGLLAIKQIDTIALANTTSTSLVDIDATTAAITVTVPANGKVLITANPYGWMSGASAHGGIGLREAAADVAGSTRLCFYNTNAQISLSRANYRVLLTGLTPGTTHTYKLAMKVNTTGTLNLGISATEGPTYMEAWAVDQVQMSTQIGTSALLAKKTYAHSGTLNIASDTESDVDATNLAVTFTAPPSGNVMVRLEGLAAVSASTAYMWWSVREGAAAVAGPYKVTGNANTQMVTATFYISGISAGSHTYKWGFRRDGGVTGSIFSQASFNAPPAVIEVWAAP